MPMIETNTINNGNRIPTKGQPLIEYWAAQIEEGLRYRRIFGRSGEWNKYKNAYRGFFDERVVPVNIIYAIGRAMIPQIYFRNPKLKVVANKPGYQMHARVRERLSRYLVTQLNIKETMKSEILDCYLCGRSLGVLGYDSEFGYSSELSSEILGDASLSQFGDEGDKIEYRLNVKPGMPWYLRCNPLDFIVPYGSGPRFDDIPWYAYRVMRPLHDILEDQKYKGVKDIKATHFSRLERNDEGMTAYDMNPSSRSERGEWVELWNIHDQRTGNLYVWPKGHKSFIRNEFDDLQINGLNAKTLGFNEDPDYFWWTPDARLIMTQQLEINDIRTMSRAHRRVALLKILYGKGMVGKTELTKLLDGDVKTACEIDVGTSGDIRKAVALLQAHTHPDLTIASREVREDVREIIGFSRNQAGAFEAPSGRRTATEAQLVQQASMIRIDERRDIVADHFIDVMKTILGITDKFWTQRKVIDIIGPDGVRYWTSFTGPQLVGDYTYISDAEEAQPLNSLVQRQEALQLMEVLAKVGAGVNLKYILSEWAGTFDWVDPKMLFPGEGAGRSPERPVAFEDLNQLISQGGNQGG